MSGSFFFLGGGWCYFIILCVEQGSIYIESDPWRCVYCMACEEYPYLFGLSNCNVISTPACTAVSRHFSAGACYVPTVAVGSRARLFPGESQFSLMLLTQAAAKEKNMFRDL